MTRRSQYLGVMFVFKSVLNVSGVLSEILWLVTNSVQMCALAYYQCLCPMQYCAYVLRT